MPSHVVAGSGVRTLADAATAAWTEFRLRFVLTGAVLVASGVLVGVEEGTPRVALLLMVVVVTVAALQFDAFVGIVIGLVGAAAMVLVKRLSGSWGPQELFVVAAEVTTLIELAWIVGLLGNHLKEGFRRLSRPVAGSFQPAHGSLGLLDGAPASSRLDEELQRRSRTGQPLALMLLSADVVDGHLDDEAITAARRAVARHVETLARHTDVPFALSPRIIGVILPDTDRADAWAVLGASVETAGKATFADRMTGERHLVSDIVDLRACLVLADDATERAADLLKAALHELERHMDFRANA